MSDTTSVGIDFPRQIERCTQLAATYDALPDGVGAFGAAHIRATVARAQEAWASGILIDILAAYEALRGCE